jgi:hypothetical protein
MVVSMQRFNKLVTDILLDPGNSLTGSVNQLGDDAGWLSTFGTAFVNIASPYNSLPNFPVVVGIRSSPTTGVRFWHSNFYDTSNAYNIFTTSHNVVSNATATGLTFGGRNALDLFMSGDLWMLEDWPGEFTDADMSASVLNIFNYMVSIGVPMKPSGTQTTLIVIGDSNAQSIACNQYSTSLGGVVNAGMIGTYSDLQWWMLGAPTRQFIHMDLTSLQPTIDFCRATNGKTVIICSCGENDETVVTGAATYARAQSHFGAIKAACPWVKIIWIEPLNRGDVDTSAAIAALAALITADPTVGGTCDAVYRTSMDSILGLRTTWSTPNVTYVNGDKIHVKDAFWARVWSGTDAPQSLQTITTNVFATAPINQGAVAGGYGKGGRSGVGVASSAGVGIG